MRYRGTDRDDGGSEWRTEAADAGMARRQFVKLSAIAGLAGGLATGPASGAGREAGSLSAGVARRDITPENGMPFSGYVRPDIFADGVSTRLFADALVLDDGERKIALVAADLRKPGVRDAVLEHVRRLGFDRDTVLFAATHTHAGPAEIGDWIAGQIGDAVAEADESKVPARAGWGQGTVTDANWNRSLEAHLANFGLDVPIGEASPEDHPVDPERARDGSVKLLRVEDTDGTPVAAWTLFGTHPTAFTPANTTFSADFPGAAREWFGRRFDDGEAPVAMFTNGRVGDQIPHYDDYGMYAVAERTGMRVERGMWDAWTNAAADLARNLPVGGRSIESEYRGQEVEPGTRVADAAVVGLPILHGGENGPTPFSGLDTEGERRPASMADDVHGRKILLAPAPYSTDVEVQAVRVGNRLLITVPGEPTVEMGRRMREGVAAAVPDAFEDVAVVGVANGYNGYFTTPEEYDTQDYEGSNTAFGKYTSLLVGNLQRAASADLTRDPGEAPAPSGSRPPVPDAPVGGGSESGRLREQPAALVERMDVVTASWRGGSKGRDRPVGEPFLVLERQVGDDWQSVATDLGLGFQWREHFGVYDATFDVPASFPTGTYRLRIDAARYELTSRAFAIVPSAKLLVRGARLDGDRAVFVAQNPPPDPEQNLRMRPLRPTGGTLTVRYDDSEHEATWDADAMGWVTTLDAGRGETVAVPAFGLVDEYGNTNLRSAAVELGTVADREWPETVETGGGDPPGLFGIGTFPT